MAELSRKEQFGEQEKFCGTDAGQTAEAKSHIRRVFQMLYDCLASSSAYSRIPEAEPTIERRTPTETHVSSVITSATALESLDEELASKLEVYFLLENEKTKQKVIRKLKAVQRHLRKLSEPLLQKDELIQIILSSVLGSMYTASIEPDIEGFYPELQLLMGDLSWAQSCLGSIHICTFSTLLQFREILCKLDIVVADIYVRLNAWRRVHKYVEESGLRGPELKQLCLDLVTGLGDLRQRMSTWRHRLTLAVLDCQREGRTYEDSKRGRRQMSLRADLRSANLVKWAWRYGGRGRR